MKTRFVCYGTLRDSDGQLLTQLATGLFRSHFDSFLNILGNLFIREL